MQKIGLTFLVTLLFSTSAYAQLAGQSRPITVTFNGVVTNSAADTIRLRQSDGTYTNYAGPLPDFPYKDGDQVSISFNTTAPTAAYYNYTGQTAADGIYRVALTGPNNSGGVFGRVSTVSLPTGTRLGINSGQPFGIGNLSLVYDANADSYSIDFGAPSAPNVPANGTATIGLLDGPGLSYDPTTQTIARTNSTCVGGSAAGCAIGGGPGGYAFTLSGNSVSANNIPVFGPDPNGVGGPLSAILGLFDFGFTGSWSLPTFGGTNPGGPIDVPEPSMLLLFGGGVAALMRRRRKAAAA